MIQKYRVTSGTLLSSARRVDAGIWTWVSMFMIQMLTWRTCKYPDHVSHRALDCLGRAQYWCR
ncbi:hypothetical protein ABIB25_000091 [Nakamurella sp. UYEF19]